MKPVWQRWLTWTVGPGVYGPLTILEGELVTHPSPYKRPASGLTNERNPVQNIQLDVDGNKLTIVIDLSQDFGLSSTKKSRIIAATRGNIEIPGHPGKFVGVNAYMPVK